ncbi:hypothetical protein BaRGS_00006037 [Batillaria attramentaria]|uniref:Uncharacterized protein n=1 Tax=Batillaria attramentaria TaxID=370345 RepID=A0ABD0LTH8_9CAEN
MYGRRTNSTRSQRGFQRGRAASEIEAQCLAAGALFEDLEFPAEYTTIFYSRARPYEWKRPHVSIAYDYSDQQATAFVARGASKPSIG